MVSEYDDELLQKMIEDEENAHRQVAGDDYNSDEDDVEGEEFEQHAE